MSHYADLQEKRKKAIKISICVRINSEQRMKLNDIREYLKTNLGEIPKGFYYKWKSENINDGEIIRFLIENFEIPENHEK
ncbi:hypothetical protein ES708_10971 [subsurface metagenome]